MGGVEHLFFDAMHGSTVEGASNAETHPRTDSDIAIMKKSGFAYESFSVSKNKWIMVLLSSLQKQTDPVPTLAVMLRRQALQVPYSLAHRGVRIIQGNIQWMRIEIGEVFL